MSRTTMTDAIAAKQAEIEAILSQIAEMEAGVMDDTYLDSAYSTVECLRREIRELAG